MKRITSIFAGAFLLVSGAALNAQDATIRIHDAGTGQTIPAAIYGQFSEHLGRCIYGGLWVGKDSQVPNVDGYRKDVFDALKALIEYFSQVEEPTMVVMFGDHQPKVDNQFYVDLMGGELEELSLEEAMNKYKVPFLIWANYDIPEAQGVELSLNYLSTLVAQTANFPLTGYQRALTAFYQDLPIISAVGYRDGEGTWADRENELSPQAQEALYAYHVLEYNNVFDKENRLEGFFFLDT